MSTRRPQGDHRSRGRRDAAGSPADLPRTPRPATSPALTEAVQALVGPPVAAQGLVLEGVTVTPAGSRRVVRVVVDLPDDAVGGLSLDDLSAASRAVDAALEADEKVLGQTPYVLEVGTPGTSRPLTQRRHWSRARTRLVTVPVGAPGASAAEVTGRVVAVSDDGVLLDVAVAERLVPWAELGTGRVELEFSRPGTDEPGGEVDDDTDDGKDED